MDFNSISDKIISMYNAIQNIRKYLAVIIPEVEQKSELIFAMLSPLLPSLPENVRNIISLIQKYEGTILQYLKYIQYAEEQKELKGKDKLAFALYHLAKDNYPESGFTKAEAAKAAKAIVEKDKDFNMVALMTTIGAALIGINDIVNGINKILGK